MQLSYLIAAMALLSTVSCSVFGPRANFPLHTHHARAFNNENTLPLLRLRGGHHAGYTLGVRDSIMIAHSFRGHEFGPAQGMHGATYTVDLEVHVEHLAPKLNWVVDIGFLCNVLKEVLSHYNYKNLNEIFPDDNTTTEFMSRKIHDGVSKALVSHGVKGSMTVKLFESHNAWASYTADLAHA